MAASLGRLLLLAAALTQGSRAASLHPRANAASSSSVDVTWLSDAPPALQLGTSFGVPWPRGAHRPDETRFSLGGDSAALGLQTWITGYWADGSIKWTGHAIPGTDASSDKYTIVAQTNGTNTTNATSGKRALAETKLVVSDAKRAVTVNTGKITTVFPKSGTVLVKEIRTAAGKAVGLNGRLVLQSQSGLLDESDSPRLVDFYKFQSNIHNVTVSQDSLVRAVVTVKGSHTTVNASTEHQDWLPFTVRFYLYANADAVRVVHSLVFDGTPHKDYISGLGVRFDVPLAGEALYNRHVRIAGVDGGVLSEAVQGITGLRRDPGETVRQAQYQGTATPNVSTWDTRVSSRLQWIPAWNDFRLVQHSPDGFTLAKRTKAGQSWLNIPGGTRSGGLAYLGGATKGGLAVGLRDFWKRYPSALEVHNAAANLSSVTVWLYSPTAPPLDLRPYHDGLGEDTYTEERDALEITYEDYEPGFNTPYGIARTSEVYLFAFDATPSADTIAGLVEHIHNPPTLKVAPAYLYSTKALGTFWSLPDNSSARAAEIEGHLDYLFDFYKNQIDQRRWYGFLDYGDFMHTYDADRHTWRYDVGGYAWDNSELSPDLFFWLYYLRTGREDAYRFAEALTRHTGEVDVYHIGNWTGLGTRHGVQHFGDSSKQARISQPQYRKYFFFVSGGDERVGELLEETLDTETAYGYVDPNRKVRTDGWLPSPGQPVSLGLGTDWSSLAASWLIEWERRGSRWTEARDKLTSTASGIAKLKNGFVTGTGLWDPVAKTLTAPPADLNNTGLVSVSHLSAVFGLVEVISDALDHWGAGNQPAGFKEAWLDYAYYYDATDAEKIKRYGATWKSTLRQGHSRLAAFAAKSRNDTQTAARAWAAFDGDGLTNTSSWSTDHVSGSAVLVPVDEAAWFATNDVAQYGLAAIQNLEYIVKDLK